MSPEMTAQIARDIDGYQRQDALTAASRLMTDRKDPHTVLFVAAHLLKWMRDDSNPGTAEIRNRAMIQHLRNISEGPGVTAHADDPDGFLEAAALYIPFLTADETEA